VGAPCLGIAAAGCGIDLRGELVERGDAALASSSSSGVSGRGAGSSSGTTVGSSSSGGATGSSSSGGAAGSSGGDAAASTDGGDASSPPGFDGGDDSGGRGPGPDAGPMNCNFAGTWASKVTINVNWTPQGLTGVILAPGTGVIQQWILSTRTVTGKATTDSTVVCGIALPDFSGTSFVGGETYGVRFPNSLFDNGYLSPFPMTGTLSDDSPTATFSTTASAVLIGLTLANPTVTAWPSTITTAVNTDDDANPGVTVNAATGSIPGRDSGTYSDFPVDVVSDRANQLFIVIRQVTQLAGAATDCDHITGTTTIPKIPNTTSGKYGIDSHVIGCNLTAGGTCSNSQIAFIDGTQPVFSPSGSATFASVRVKSTATCSDVRTMLPPQ
jgi:hypothetical protein